MKNDILLMGKAIHLSNFTYTAIGTFFKDATDVLEIVQDYICKAHNANTLHAKSDSDILRPSLRIGGSLRP